MSSEDASRALILTVIAIILGTSIIAGAILSLSSVSYYEGVHPSFVAVYHEGQYYTTEEPGDASVARIGLATLNFDPDSADAYTPNLQGELRDVQVITDLARYEVAETYAHIINVGGNPQPDKPYKSEIWQVGDREYQVDLWLCSFQVNTFIKADPNRYNRLISERYNQRYRDAEVWLKLETTNEWGTYFKDAEETYFGIAYMELAEYTELGNDQALDVLPQSQWTAFDLWDDPQGMPSSTPKPPQDFIDTITGAELNPEYFKSEYYTRITYGNFGTYDFNPLDGSFSADSVQHTILVHVAVFGEWKLKPDGERDIEEHEPSEIEGLLDWIRKKIDKLFSRFESPLGKIQLAILILVAVFILTILTNPKLILDWIEVGRSLIENEE